MKGQIEEQHSKDINTVREAYKNGVSDVLNVFCQIIFVESKHAVKIHTWMIGVCESMLHFYVSLYK